MRALSRRLRPGASRRKQALRALAAASFALFGALVTPACSLSDVHHDDCASDTECSSTFGVGSTCSEGYCSAPGACETGHDCRKKFGGGACVNGTCQLFLPSDPSCGTVVPPDLFTRPLAGDGAPVVIGAVFSLDEANDKAITEAIQLGVNEINQASGLLNATQLGLVICDNGGKGDLLTGDARNAQDDHVLDYLAGTLGVPYLVGPLTSDDSLQLIGHLTDKKYPTVIISPSATSPALTDAPDKISPSDQYGMFWRTCPPDALQGEVLAKDVIGTDATITSTSVVYINDAYGLGLSQVFQSDFTGMTHLFPFDDATIASGAKLTALGATVAAQDDDAILIIALHGDVAAKIVGALAGTAVGAKKYFFTDGSKDASGLLSTTLPAAVKTIIKTAIGTAPASPDPMKNPYATFAASLSAAFPGLDPSQFSFLAQGYDATYVGAYGVVAASLKHGDDFDGRDVAAGMAHLSSGVLIDVGGTDWPSGKGTLQKSGTLNINGTSGALDFDATTGEAPAPIGIWAVDADFSGFHTVMTVNP